ncbi:hypothetical protein MPTK1_6g00290 [Marchantia polymorpha subsp. ruderalis]|uniref:FAM91 N-terminal domain-containing protein n=2 Tax=Marchantia polymorpha TaxID=3197 RepID=A0A176WG77_MARPO|nr:hypothetical protein AXG93_4525s1110 [Marchantia polymorpha subsp. ruderalis]PTQ32009.1 hypothetical protein MARPO_0104s0038 [Marchantia polymorpha]PTQ32010.1 hypothetical protein MARPO_0104s0038 [Marchantia polymorpha]BBN13036.1 hypothetical protein Mp_6g00290 [Marchantia polymorpha subsp. ruderalis]BBN13037.1 hypothetical protein Mp_6g00290 [Marchantia polymorpha subsp. ruderalis]|eukprot:PTQ32009.1 hypothetical protein MARPO_0104s0038 [Marchantia polymorpha]
MQRVASTVEEDMIIKAIQEEATWEKLPKRLKIFLSSNEEWQRRVKEYCIKKRFKWSDCAARTTCKENEYYEDLMRYLRKNLALFPYHLAENICRIQRITPFRYYCDMIYEVMKNERPYDSIPNFSAADALRLTGIGRNEFIDIMNKCRAKKLMWKLNKSIAKDMLPNNPVDFPIEPWWAVSIVNLSIEEYRRLTDDEMVVIDKVGKEEVNCVGELDLDVVRGLYRRGLVWLEVPVYPDDHFQVSTLDGFVSNREQSYEDPTEELLYAVFVALSEQATVADLAQTLQADLSQLEAAVSLASRLGWAKKVMDPAALLNDLHLPGSPNIEGSVADDGFGNTRSVPASPFQEGLSEADGDIMRPQSGVTRFALMVDANLTSYLMMGSLSPGLKGHAVTLYEAGKLGDSSVAEMCEDLRQVEGKKFEGELQQLADHAFSLRHALECLRSGGAGPGGHDLAEAETDFESPEKSGADLADFQLEPSAISQASSPELSRPSSSPEIYNETSKSPDSHDIAFNAYRDESSQQETESVAGDEHHDRADSVDHASDTIQMTSSTSTIEGLGRVKSRHRKSGRKCRVDVLRVESLQGLASGTIQRVLRRDYHVLVSMIPLLSPPSVVSPDGVGPVHFGPPSRAAITPWMKLLLYSVAASGPVSIALIKGQRLRLLPPPLAGCSKALLWAWDGVGVSGLGGRFEGSLVEGGVLLHCLNSLLKYSAVLVQPFTEASLDAKGTGNVMTKNIPLPLSELSTSSAGLEGESIDETFERNQLSSSLARAAEELNLETAGFIRMVRIRKDLGLAQREVSWEWVPQSVEFGLPLFDTQLCKLVCEGVVHAELFQSPALSIHREAMLKLRRKLQEFISDHQANGPISKLTYPGGQFKPGERPLLRSLASSKWSASDFMFDPVTSPNFSSGSETLSPQLSTRRRSEVVSFVGDPTRSPLPPVYEPARRYVEEPEIDIPSNVDTKLDIWEDGDSSDVPLPGVNLIFDGQKLMPLNIALFLQGRLPVALVAEAASASECLLVAA